MQSSHVSHRILLACLAVLALAACKAEPAQPAGVIPREKFIAANVALRSLPDSAPQARRDAALKKAGVTDKQLRAWVTVYARDPEALSKAWEEIAFKVDSIGGAQPMPMTPGSPPPPPSAMGSPLPPPRRDSLLNVLPPGADSAATARRRPPRPPRPVRSDLDAAMEKVQ